MHNSPGRELDGGNRRRRELTGGDRRRRMEREACAALWRTRGDAGEGSWAVTEGGSSE